eukprot:m.175179 g.175179  ORF g.175179 m.175179 type:complete len:50 (+) comp14886_c0_seq18:273-422(+)
MTMVHEIQRSYRTRGHPYTEFSNTILHAIKISSALGETVWILHTLPFVH